MPSPTEPAALKPVASRPAEPTRRLLIQFGRAQIEQTTRSVARLVGARRPSQTALDAIPIPDTADLHVGPAHAG